MEDSKKPEVPVRDYTTEQLIEEAKKYRTVKEWCAQSRASYNAAQRRRLLEVACAHMTRAKRSWANEMILRSAKKYQTRNAWKAAAPDMYALAEERGIFDQCVEHMKLINGRTQWSWTDEDILADAKKYDKSSQWKKHSPAAYVAAIRHGILAKATEHMPKHKKVTWTVETLLADAKTYSSEIEWTVKSKSAASAAKKFGIYNQCVSHMQVRKLRPHREDAPVTEVVPAKTQDVA